MKSRQGQKRGVALVYSLVLSVLILSFISLATYSFLWDEMLQRRYEYSIPLTYQLEAGRNACQWEEAHATPPNSWATTTGTLVVHLQGAAIDASGFYTLPNYTFRVKVNNIAGKVRMLVHAFVNSAAAPYFSLYGEYINTPDPMYQYMQFSVQSLGYGYYNGGLIDCKGGKIHSNADIRFAPQQWGSDGIRFKGLREMSASGTIGYSLSGQYPSPGVLNAEFGPGVPGMIAAPSMIGNLANGWPWYDHAYTTVSGDGSQNEWWYLPGPWFPMWPANNLSPGPWLYATTPTGTVNSYMSAKWYESSLTSFSSFSGVPDILTGEEGHFYGNQFQDGRIYLDKNGNDNWYSDFNPSDKATVNQIGYDLNSGSLQLTNWDPFTAGPNYRIGNVFFQPYEDKLGNSNQSWFELPGALPESYYWNSSTVGADKYVYNWYDGALGNGEPVKFYVTEPCSIGSSGCLSDSNYQTYINPANTLGWRYRKTDVSGSACTTDACYNDAASQYLPINNYQITPPAPGTFLDQLGWMSEPDDVSARRDNRDLSFLHSGGVYGADANDPVSPDRLINVFDSRNQPNGFQQYLSLLSSQNMEGVIQSGVPAKEPFYKSVFDTPTTPSPYRTTAGSYVVDGNDAASVASFITKLGSCNGNSVAKTVTFFNWKSSMPITVLDIDVGSMKQCSDLSDFKGVIYAKNIPIRLSDANALPSPSGVTAGKSPVFTLISEESVYLKGDYNNPVSDQDWVISNIATKQNVYLLSNAFNDPQQPPDFRFYPEYPYVYASMDGTGRITGTQDPATPGGLWVWAYDVSDMINYQHYNIDPATAQILVDTMNAQQQAYVTSHPNTPDQVDKAQYSYNSVFITPNNSVGDTSLEDWTYNGQKATARINGSEINFYDSNHPEYYAPLSAAESNWNYRWTPGFSGNAYSIQWYAGSSYYAGDTPHVLSYDSRFPAATPANPDAVLGFTGLILWRPVSQDYFENNI